MNKSDLMFLDKIALIDTCLELYAANLQAQKSFEEVNALCNILRKSVHINTYRAAQREVFK
jgi:hypothetical protein